MNRNIIIGIAVASMFGILGYTVYIWNGGQNPENNHRSSDSIKAADSAAQPGTELDPKRTAAKEAGGQLQNDARLDVKNKANSNDLDKTDIPSSMHQIEEAFSGTTSIMEALQNVNAKENWGYDRVFKNLSLWKDLCEARESGLNSERNSENANLKPTPERIAAFCRDYSSDISEELDDFAFTSLQETALGVNDWSKRLNSVDDLGPERALRTAIIDLSGMLYSGDYASVLEIVWFLGTSRLLIQELHIDGAVSELFADVEVMIAVGASLYCVQLGNCSGNHPVTLALCFQFRDRPCNNPGNIHHAIEQILTGRELTAFYKMHGEIISLLSRYRRGEF